MSETMWETVRELVQPIILLVDRIEPAPEAQGIAAAALASVQAYWAAPENPLWAEWAEGAFAKSVRRADAKMFAKVCAAYPEQAVTAVGVARAVGLPPLPADALPKLLAKLQVSGTQLPAGEAGEGDGAGAGGAAGPALAGGAAAPGAVEAALTIVLNGALNMSTGKAAAQAAHALFAWVLEAPPALVAAWEASGHPVGVRTAAPKDFRKGARRASGPVIRDAGRTEIAPGSTTAYVVTTLRA